MSNKKLQKSVSIFTTLTTAAWMSGVAILAPMATMAAVVDGDIVSPDAEFTEDGMPYYPYDVFIVKIINGKTFKRLVLNPEVFDSYGHLEWGNIQTISADTVAGYTTSNLVRADGDDKVYELVPDGDSGEKNWVESLDCFNSQSYDWDSVYIINSVDRDNYTTGANVCASGVSEGTLTVSLAADTPAAGYALMNSTRVPFTKVNFTATGGDVIVDSMVVQRTGSPASDSAFSGVNILKPNGDLLSSSYKTLNSSHQASFTDDITVSNGTTESYVLVGQMADVSTYAGEVPKLALAEMTLSGDATLNATLPIEGNSMTINGTVNIADLALSETPDVGTATKEVGTTDFDFAHVKMTNSASNADIQIESVKFNNAGSADDADIENIKLLKYATSEVLAEAEMESNYIYFDLSDCGDNCKIEKGQNATFTLRGDIIGGSGRTLDFDIKKVEHVVAKDLLNDVYVTPSGTIDYGNIITISRGKLNVTKTNTVAAGNITDNSSDVELGSWNFDVTGESITVNSIKFDIEVSGSTAEATDFTSLVLTNKTTGETLTGGNDGVTDGDGYVTFTDSFTLPIGDNEIIMTGTINSDPTVNDTVQFGVDFMAATNLDATGDVTGDSIDLSATAADCYATPWGVEIDASLLTFKDLSLAVTTLAQPAAKTIAAGTTNVLYSTINFDATDSSENVKVTQFKITIVSDTTAKANEIQNIRFEVDGEDLGVTKNGSETTASNTSEQITVSLSGDEQFVVEKGTSDTMEIYADLSSGATAAGTHQIQISSGTSDTVTAIGETSGNDVTETYSSATASAVTVGTAGGTVKVSADSSNPAGALLAAGTKGVTLAAFNFLATSTEDVEIDYLYLTQVTTDDDSSSYKDYDRIYFENEDGEEVAGTSMTPTSTEPKINFADDAFVVDINDNDGEILYLKADLAAIGTSYNGVAGHYLGYSIDDAATDVVAKGDLTGSDSHEYAGTTAPTGNSFYVYKSYPTFAKVAVATNKLGNGNMDLYKFTVTADDSGDIALYKFVFDIATTVCTVQEDSLYVYDVTGTEYALNETAGSASLGIWDTSGWDATTLGSSQEVVVSKGTTRTFVLRGNISAAGTGASVTTRIGGDSAHISNAGATLMDAADDIDGIDVEDDFIWSDKSQGAHTYETNDWTNGYLVSGLSSSSSTPETIAY